MSTRIPPIVGHSMSPECWARHFFCLGADLRVSPQRKYVERLCISQRANVWHSHSLLVSSGRPGCRYDFSSDAAGSCAHMSSIVMSSTVPFSPHACGTSGVRMPTTWAAFGGGGEGRRTRQRWAPKERVPLWVSRNFGSAQLVSQSNLGHSRWGRPGGGCSRRSLMQCRAAAGAFDRPGAIRIVVQWKILPRSWSLMLNRISHVACPRSSCATAASAPVRPALVGMCLSPRFMLCVVREPFEQDM